jgi:threonine/homoserine/homoserine lactone efflux protein
MHLFLEGLLMGVVPVFFVGPVLFTLLAASLEAGFWAGAQVALGIAVSDVVAIALCAAGVGPLLTQPWGQWALELAGGLILLGFGVVMAASAAKVAAPEAKRSSGGRRFLAGFAVNFVNPFVFTFWIGAIGGLGAKEGLSIGTLVPFFGGMVTTILVTDLMKAGAASALQQRLSGPGLTWARRISGVLLAGAGLWLLGMAATGWPPGGTP